MDEEKQEIFKATPIFVLPGDIVDPLKFYTQGENESNISSVDKVIKLGPGLIQREDSIIATAAGMLQHSYKENRFWVDFNSKRYVPSTGDSVIGVVTKKFTENFSVDIGASVSASLSVFAFEGATKRNRPAVNVGDLVYVKVTLAHKDIEPEVEAFNSHTGRSEGFGPLKNGFAFKCSIGLCRSLLKPKCTVLEALGSQLAFEIAIGLNGCVWVSGKNSKETILIRSAILNSEFLADAIDCQRMVSLLIDDL